MFEYKLDSMRRAMQAPDTPEDSDSRTIKSKNLVKETQHASEIASNNKEKPATKQMDSSEPNHPKTTVQGEISNQTVLDQVQKKETGVETTKQEEDEFGDIDIEINFDDGDNEE